MAHPRRISKAEADRIAAQWREDKAQAKRDDAGRKRREQEGNRGK